MSSAKWGSFCLELKIGNSRRTNRVLVSIADLMYWCWNTMPSTSTTLTDCLLYRTSSAGMVKYKGTYSSVRRKTWSDRLGYQIGKYFFCGFKNTHDRDMDSGSVCLGILFFWVTCRLPRFIFSKPIIWYNDAITDDVLTVTGYDDGLIFSHQNMYRNRSVRIPANSDMLDYGYQVLSRIWLSENLTMALPFSYTNFCFTF